MQKKSRRSKIVSIVKAFHICEDDFREGGRHKATMVVVMVVAMGEKHKLKSFLFFASLC